MKSPANFRMPIIAALLLLFITGCAAESNRSQGDDDQPIYDGNIPSDGDRTDSDDIDDVTDGDQLDGDEDGELDGSEVGDSDIEDDGYLDGDAEENDGGDEDGDIDTDLEITEACVQEGGFCLEEEALATPCPENYHPAESLLGCAAGSVCCLSDSVATCNSLDACPGDQVCNLSLGRCETRSSLIDLDSGLFSFHPPSGVRGDLLAIDGKRFFYSLVGNFSVKVWIGATQLAFTDYIAWDESRLLVRIPNDASGIIGVQCEGGMLVQSREAFCVLPTGAIACDGSTPVASGVTGAVPIQLGPFAAGFLEYTNDGIRIFYPAQCGSIRRQAVSGSYPLVVILHGNGAAHVNYDYLGQLLASRGFVVVNPPSIHTNSYDEEVIDKLYNDISAVNGKSLVSIHPALAGVSTTGDVGFICHSRGCGRQQELMGDYPGLANKTKASVFLGPANTDVVVPGHFMVFGATNDGQSFASNYNGQYNRQTAPKWKIVIQGGNHSLFTDVKVYYSMDGVPTITRQRQLSIVASFVIPLMEHAFGLSETSPEWLDNPPSSPDYAAESVP